MDLARRLPATVIVLQVLFLIASLFATCCTGLASKKGGGSNTAGTGFGTPKSVQVHTADTSTEVQKLVSVLQQQPGTQLTGTEIGVDPATGRRGLYATKNFSKDKVIVKIPSDLALALSDPAQNGEDAPTIAHGGANFLKFYKNNAQAAQQWAFYLDALPRSVPRTPDYFDDEEIQLLEFPRIIAAAKRRKQEIQQVAKETGIDETELKEATALVSSRAFPLAVAEADQDLGNEVGDIALDERGQVMTKAGERKFIRVLCPYIDMANHRSGQCNAKWTVLDPEKDDAFFALVATRNIKTGKEITISYGSQVDSTVELLLNYGFVPEEGNIFDEFMLKKGGDDCIASVDDWTTTLEEDKTMLSMTEGDADAENLRKILQFRIQMKKSYPKEK